MPDVGRPFQGRLPAGAESPGLRTEPDATAAAQPIAAATDPDAGARAFAIDPRNNVVLEASAGTGKTSVLVWRYVNLLGLPHGRPAAGGDLMNAGGVRCAATSKCTSSGT